MIRFDGTFIENIAAAQFGAISGPLQSRHLPDPGQLERLRQVIHAAAPELLHPDTDRWRRAAVNMLVKEAAVDAFHATPDVARGWGFGHLGRFASYYADTFGKRPSDALRRPSRWLSSNTESGPDSRSAIETARQPVAPHS